MAVSYAFQPWFQSVPNDGITTTIDVRAAFRDLPQGYVKLALKYDPVLDKAEDINRNNQDEVFGLRFGADLTLEIYNMADFAFLQGIISRLRFRRNWKTYFSLDGGATSFQVTIKGYKGPESIKGKTYIGANFVLSLEGVELLDEPPLITTALPAPLTTYYARTLPPPAAQYRGQIWNAEGTGSSPDVSSICLRNQDGVTYDWQPIASGV